MKLIFAVFALVPSLCSGFTAVSPYRRTHSPPSTFAISKYHRTTTLNESPTDIDADTLPLLSTGDATTDSAISNTADLIDTASQQIEIPLTKALNTLSPSPEVMSPSTSTSLDIIALVAGQENYGLAIVCLGEAIWSFAQAPSLDHAKIFLPAIVSSAVLVLVSGPMITSGDASSVSLGLEIATGVSVLLGLTYVARLVAPFSPSPKEITFLGLLFAIAGFFSFAQNLVVDGFITLPSLPTIQLPTLPSISLPF